MTEDALELHVRFQDRELSPQQVENITWGFRHTLNQEFGRITQELSANKDGDALALGLLTLTLIPSMLPKFLDFLHAWAMRRENRHIKVKIQLSDKSVEIEVPQTSSPDEIKKWMELANDSLSAKGTKNKKSQV